MQGPEQHWSKKIPISISSMVLYHLGQTYKPFTYAPSETSDRNINIDPALKLLPSTICKNN